MSDELTSQPRDLPRSGTGASAEPARRERRPGWRDYTAFVLSSGGARGALQVGALKALLERGITPDVIVGTSIGSWNGAVLALDPSERGIEKLLKVWGGLTTSRILLGWEPHLPTAAPAFAGAFVVAAIRRATLGYPSLYGDAGLRQVFHENLQGMRFEDAKVPFRVIASNLTSGGLTVFGRGPVELALLASAAIPGIFPPVRIAGDIYVDGGALESSSLQAAIDLGARRIFVLDAGYDVTPELDDELQALVQRLPRTSKQPNAHALAVVLERTATMMGRYQLDRAIERVPPGIETHVIRPTSSMNEAALDFDHAASWINVAYEQAKMYLDRRLPQPEHAQPESAVEHADASDVEDNAAQRVG